MGKLIVLFFITISSLAFSPDNIFQDDLSIIDTLSTKVSGTHKSASKSSIFGKFLKDPENRISEDFKIPSPLKSRVLFWFMVYTQHDSTHSVLHDIENLGIIYDVINFKELTESGLNKNTRYSLQNKAMREIVKNYKAAFKKLESKDCFGEKCKIILDTLEEQKISIPKSSSKRRLFFRKLSNNLRTQTGQKDHILQGLKNLEGYTETVEILFKSFDLPHELLAISFLESSFNIHARSKVGATGPWQFMNVIGKHFFTMNKFSDQRKSAVLSTAGALHLLAQNRKIMKSWDLAVNAYNSGTGLLRRGVKTLKAKGFSDVSVDNLIEHFKHPNWGFAAKNFYSEFLALVYTLAYKKEVYGSHFNDKDGIINIYITKCKIPVLKLLPSLSSSKKNLMALNNHLNRNYKRTSYPKGSVVLSDVDLTTKKYFKVEHELLRRRYPKNLYKFVKNQSCSNK
ncbi:MAG: transglycosylase SLT domain-containing protein [Bacteriovoracaceae bacterium]|nr:transglycosylase SLT domain-containing protein [Bacteriovoracaceae bacterium]